MIGKYTHNELVFIVLLTLVSGPVGLVVSLLWCRYFPAEESES